MVSQWTGAIIINLRRVNEFWKAKTEHTDRHEVRKLTAFKLGSEPTKPTKFLQNKAGWPYFSFTHCTDSPGIMHIIHIRHTNPSHRNSILFDSKREDLHTATQEQTLHNTETCSRPRFYSLNARNASHSSVFTASAMSLVYTMRSLSLTSANTSTYMRPPLATHFAGIVKLDKCTAIMQVTYLRTGVALTMHADVQ